LHTWQLRPEQGRLDAVLPLTGYAAGMYLLRIRTGAGWTYHRLILE
jgi:hypothetical protein